MLHLLPQLVELFLVFGAVIYDEAHLYQDGVALIVIKVASCVHTQMLNHLFEVSLEALVDVFLGGFLDFLAAWLFLQIL